MDVDIEVYVDSRLHVHGGAPSHDRQRQVAHATDRFDGRQPAEDAADAPVRIVRGARRGRCRGEPHVERDRVIDIEPGVRRPEPQESVKKDKRAAEQDEAGRHLRRDEHVRAPDSPPGCRRVRRQHWCRPHVIDRQGGREAARGGDHEDERAAIERG